MSVGKRDANSDADLRRKLRDDLETAQQEFHEMMAMVPNEAWTAPSKNPGWTNGQLLFHILLGFILVRPLASLLVFSGHLPGSWSRVFAGLLDWSTPLFHRINAIGPRAAARILGRRGVARKFDQVHRGVLALLERVQPRQWALAMHYPVRWDPRFRQDMGLEDLFRYPVSHLRHHRSQLRTTKQALQLAGEAE